MGFTCHSWWLPPPRTLGASRIIERMLVIVSGSDRGDCEGFLTFPGGEPKGTIVNCSWLVWSSSCIGCAAPYSGFDVWCQLAREPPSEWITTTETSLPASKWTSEEKSLCLIVSLVFIGIHWLITCHGDIPLYHSCITLYLYMCRACGSCS